MGWTWVLDFFGGAFLANAVLHFVNGISGRPFPTPFANPPGRGLSSPVVNVLWGSLNVFLGWVLLWGVGAFDTHRWPDVIAFGLGAVLIAVLLARAFGKRLGPG